MYFNLDLYSLTFWNHANPPFLLSLDKIPILYFEKRNGLSNVFHTYINKIFSTYECRKKINKARNTYVNCFNCNSSACHLLSALSICLGMQTRRKDSRHILGTTSIKAREQECQTRLKIEVISSEVI